jgi:hypothetical protein
MILRSELPIIFDGQDEVILEGDTVDYQLKESCHLIQSTIIYLNIFREYLNDPETTEFEKTILDKKKEVIEKGYMILLNRISYFLGNDNAIKLVTEFDLNIKLKWND